MSDKQWIAEWDAWLRELLMANSLYAAMLMATEKLAELRKRAAKQDDDRGGD
jgi:hypothetical protein